MNAGGRPGVKQPGPVSGCLKISDKKTYQPATPSRPCGRPFQREFIITMDAPLNPSQTATAEAPQYPRITVYHDWCKHCGICVAFCPKEVLAMDENRRVYPKFPENCIACHMCELRCPDFAINVAEVKK
jgi:2-oxoglutarate ferredoxin oxidoreductase subunit delta